MNGKALIPLVAGLAIGGFALWIGVQTLRGVQGAQKPVRTAEVWVARETIPRGAEITAEMVQPMPFPANLLPKSAITDKSNLVGRVPRVDAPGGLPILEEMLLVRGARPGIFVKSGYRAVAVKIDESSGVDYHLQPGCFVDVVGSFPVRRDGQQETLARTVVENVEVAAVGPRISAADSRDENEKGNNNRQVRAVTLFVRPEDVPKLLLAEQRGKIKLSLRADSDSSRELLGTHPVSDLDLTGERAEQESDLAKTGSSLLETIRNFFNPPPPPPPPVIAPPPPPPIEVPDESWEVVVYRGDARETMKFKDQNSREQVKAKSSANGPALFENPNKTSAANPPATPPADPPEASTPSPANEPNQPTPDPEPEPEPAKESQE